MAARAKQLTSDTRIVNPLYVAFLRIESLSSSTVKRPPAMKKKFFSEDEDANQ